MNIAGWSSSVARWAHNPKVEGSNPSPATKMVSWCSWLTRLPVTQKIAGSSPVETAIWLHSSVGRARDWKSLCRWFDSRWSHHFLNFIETCLTEYIVGYAPVAQLDRVFGYEPKGQGFESLAARHGKSTCILQVLFLTKFAAVRQVKGLRREMHLRCVKYLLRGC